VIKRCQVLFSAENKEQVKELSYSQLAKILSDLIHFQFNGFNVAMAMLDHLPRNDKKEEGAAEAISGLNVQPTIRLLDSIASNPNQIDSLDFLVRRLEKELRQHVQ